MEIKDIICRLLGDISVFCETDHDDEVMKNLDGYEEALENIVERISDCASWKGDPRGSANSCGAKAQRILVVSISDYIDQKTAKALVESLCDIYGFEAMTGKEKAK